MEESLAVLAEKFGGSLEHRSKKLEDSASLKLRSAGEQAFQGQDLAEIEVQMVGVEPSERMVDPVPGVEKGEEVSVETGNTASTANYPPAGLQTADVERPTVVGSPSTSTRSKQLPAASARGFADRWRNPDYPFQQHLDTDLRDRDSSLIFHRLPTKSGISA